MNNVIWYWSATLTTYFHEYRELVVERKPLRHLYHEMGEIMGCKEKNPGHEMTRPEQLQTGCPAAGTDLDRYTALYDFAPVGYVTLGRDETVHCANLTMAELLNIHRSRLLGQRFGLFVAEELRAHVADFLRTAFTSQRKETCEVTLVRDDGTPLIVQLDAIVTATMQECSVAVIDITQRKRAEASLLEAARTLEQERDILQSVMNGANNTHLVYLDRDFNFVRVNETYAQSCGYRPEEMIGKNHFALYPDRENETIFVRVRDTGESVTCHDKKFQFPDQPERGTTYWDWTLAPVEDAGGIVTGLVLSLHETTERKRTEEMLRESEELLQFFIEFAPAALAMFDRQMRYLHLSRRWRADYGLGDRDVRGVSHYEIFPEISELWKEAHRRGMSGEVLRAEADSFQRADGSIQWVRWEIRPWHESSGAVGGIVIFAEEITQRIQAESELQKAHDVLEMRVRERTAELAETVENLQCETARRLHVLEELRKNERMLVQQNRLAAMGEMVNNIAHQWRQPLNTLGLAIQDLPLSLELGYFSKEHLDARVAKAMQLINHLSKTIDDFRNFFRPDKQKEPFHVSRVIGDTVALMGGSYQHLTINVETGVDPVVTGYPNEFAQVLLNILNNARDALNARAPERPTIAISLHEEAGRVVVLVRDNGGGIPEQIMEKIFDPYFTTKGPDQGTGLGLYMAKTIVEINMGGRLTVANTEDGAEFRIEV
jgi:PAS domain S-box-containing protein